MFQHLKIAALALAITVGLTGTALAHDEDDKHRKDRDHRGHYADAREYGQDRGYRDGYNHGREDRFRRAGYNYKHGHDYKRGDRGFESWMGSKGQYKKGYREGYHRGYDDAYYGRTNRGPIWAGWPDDGHRRDDDDWWRGRDRDRDDDDRDWIGSRRGAEVARRHGFDDGVWFGRNDAARRRSYNPRDAKGYKDADHGYRIAFGSKNSFRQQYRVAFLQGYEQGYHGWRASR